MISPIRDAEGNITHAVYSAEDITERLQAEETLRFTRFAIDRASDPAFWMGPDARFMYVNDAACRRLGYAREELLAMTVHDIDPDFPAEVWPAHWKEVKEQGSFTLDSHHRTKDGQVFPVEITVNYVEFEGREYNFAFARDITERKRVEQLLRALNQVALIVQRALTSEEIFTAAAEEFKRLGIICTVLLMKGDQTKLLPRFLSYETAALQAAGKLVGLTVEDISIPIEDVDVYRKAVWDGEATFVENAEEPLRQILPKKARRFTGQIAKILNVPKTIVTPLIVEERVIGVLSVESDDLIEEDIPAITAFAHQMSAALRKAQLYDAVQQELAERRQAEKALRESEALLSESQAIAHIGSWELDLAATRLTWSDEVYRMFGLCPQEFDATYEAFLDAVHPDDRAAVDAAYTASLREGRDTYEIEHRIVRQDDGEVRVVHEKCEHVRDASGRIVRSVGMVQDITERKQVEEALRQSELRFRSLIEQTSDAIFCYEYDPPVPTDLPVEEQIERFYQGILVECNDVCANSYGATRAEEVTGQKLTDLFGTVPGSLDAFFRAFIQNGYHADGLEGTEVFDDGTEHYFLNNGHGVVENGMLIRVWGTFRDITERKRAEVALRRSEQRFRHFFEKAPGYCYMVSPGGTIQDVNEAALETLGYEKGELVGKPLAMTYAPESLPRMKKLLTQWEQTGELDNEEIVISTKEGERRTVLLSAGAVRDQDGRIVHSVSVQRDITERKQAEAALRQSEEKFRTLAEKSPNMIFINKMGRVVYANEKSEELLEYTREEYYSPDFDFLTLIAPESIDTVRSAFGKHMKGEEIEPYEYTLITKAGKRIDAIVTTTLIDYEDERAILGIVTDITERARVEAERARSQRLLLALSQAARAVQRARTSEGVHQAIGGEIAGLGYQATIFTLTEDRAHLVLSHMTLGPTVVRAAEKLTGISAKGYRFRLVPGGFYERIIEEGEAVFSDPARGPMSEAAPRLARPLARRLAAMLGIGKAIYAPLQIDGKTHSVLTVIGDDLTETDVPAVTAFANQAAIALENARLYEAAQQELSERRRAEQALRRSEERFRELFEDSPIPLWEEDFSAVKAHLDDLRAAGIRDFRGYFLDHPEAVAACAKMVEVLDVNRTTLELYQVGSKEALCGELTKAFGPESYDAFREELIAIAEGKTTFEGDATVETLGGQKRHTLTRWSVAPGHESALSRVLVSIIDITARKQAEDALRRRVAQLALINEIGSKLTATLDLQQVLDLAARLVQEKFGYHHVAVFTVDRGREEVVMRARAGSYLSLFPLDYRLGTGEGMVGWVAVHGERLLANDAEAEPRYVNVFPDLIPTQSELSVPIRVGGEVIGVLDAQSPHLAAFEENDVMVMETVADQIAVAIEDARLYGAIQQELTERRRAEADLRRSEEKYRNIIESIPMGMHMYQLEPDGRLVFIDANPAADRILGVDNLQFVTKTIEEAFPALTETEIPARYRQVASDGHTRHWDDIYYEENQISGAFEVHAFQTSPGRMAAAFLDITERKQAEEKIRQQNEFLNSILESLTHPFYVVNVSDYSIEVANSAARQGRSLDALTCFALSHHSDEPCHGRQHPCPLEKVRRVKEPIMVEHVHHDRDGNPRNFEVHCYPILDDDGQVVQAIEYILDISERKQAEQMLLQSERLAAMGRLAASVAHEINNPLQAVEGCLTLAKEDLADRQRPEKVERYLDIAAGEIERIADIVRRVRDFYRPTVTGMQPTDVHAVLESVLALANKQLQHGRVIVERAWDDDLPTIQANPDHLKQVFLNLMLNAIDAMPDGGILRLRTVPHLMPTGGDQSPLPAVYIEFSDTGQGMSPEMQARLFEPFFTTKEHGSGLGLYISHGIIESHKGQINVTTYPGLGTTFSILLPVEQS